MAIIICVSRAYVLLVCEHLVWHHLSGHLRVHTLHALHEHHRVEARRVHLLRSWF
jgi:hypothetical protein